MIKTLLSAGALLCTCLPICFATTLDWDQVNWIGGSTSQTFFDVEGSGVDVTITLSLSYDSKTHRDYWGHRYKTTTSFLPGGPDDTTDFGGDWYEQDEESLYLGVNFSSDKRDKSYLDVTISFSESVSNVSFDLFDVDAYGYNYTGANETGIQFRDVIEQIESEYQGAEGGDATVGYDPSKIYTAESNGDTRYYGNTDLYYSNDQSDNPASVLNVGWSSPVDSVSFRYTTGSDPVRDPGQQAIGLSDISFYNYNAVPEPSTYMFGGLCSLGLLFSIIRKQKQKSKMMPN